jgi:cysteine synthase
MVYTKDPKTDSVLQNKNKIPALIAGANVWAAVQRARKLGAGKNIVTVIVDSGLKYLSGELYK